MEWVYEPGANFIGHGFLAVDFFFCLSGFVIGYAYDSRIKIIGIKEFIKARANQAPADGSVRNYAGFNRLPIRSFRYLPVLIFKWQDHYYIFVFTLCNPFSGDAGTVV